MQKMCKPTMIAYAHTHIYTHTEDNQLISPFYALQHLSLPYCRVQNIPAHLNEPTAAPGPEEMSYMQHMIPRPTPITLPIRLLNDNAADGPQPMDIDQPSPVQSMIPPHRERFHRRGGVSLPSGTGAALDGNTPFETVTVTMRIEITLRRPSPQQPVFRFSQEAARTGVVGYHDPQTEARFNNSGNSWTRNELARLLRLKRSGMRMCQIRRVFPHKTLASIRRQYHAIA